MNLSPKTTINNNTMISKIKKRNGELVDFDASKLNLWGQWAASLNVDWSSVALGATRKCFNECTTEDIQNAMISECVDRETTPHLKMANRLYMGTVYKKAFGDWRTIPTIVEMYNHMTDLGLWSKMDYSKEELIKLESVINHKLDLEATYTETKQIMDKYAITNTVEGIIYESPQFMYMRMALGNMEKMPKDRRLVDVAKLYSYFSQKKINPPTPFCINLGTNKKQYASCCVSTTLDTAASLSVQDHIAYMMTCAGAGIGSHIKSRSIGDKVRGGKVKHQGKLPYYRVQEASVLANMQSGRGGANTMHFNVLDPELLDLMALKNVQTVDQKRIKDLDYSIGVNTEFARRVAKNESWTLVSYIDSPELYESMYKADQTEFLRLYAEAEANPKIRKQTISARSIAIKFLTESMENRFYFHRTDEMNRHTPFKDTIYSSNLCQEIGLPTKGYETVQDLYKTEAGTGEIGLCSLAAICAGNVSPEEYEDVSYYTLLMIDNVIDIMEYPFPQLSVTARARRSVGVGITNLAYDMAKNNLRYSSLEGKQYIHRLAETHSFFLHKASLRLAKERGVCEWIGKTKYPDGWLPIDTANKEIDKVVNQPLVHDWETLRLEIVAFGGIRNSVLEAHMPCESSSIGSGTTNGLYPIRGYQIIKTNGTKKNLFIAPDLENLMYRYELATDVPTKDLIEVYSIVQKFTGQAISSDFYVDYSKKQDRSVGTTELITEFLYKIKMGLKTQYYINSITGVGLEMLKEQESVCESCSL